MEMETLDPNLYQPGGGEELLILLLLPGDEGRGRAWIRMQLEKEPLGRNEELLTESAQQLFVVSRSHRSVCRLKEAEEVFLWTAEELNPARVSGW